MSQFARIVSYIAHPIFVPMAVCLLFMQACTAEWATHALKQMHLWQIQLFVNTIFFPLLVIALMRGIGFIQNFHMRNTRERLGPLMAIMLFYFWNFWVFHKLTHTPLIFRTFLLATFLTIALLFMLTIFVKVSMHSAAIWGALTMCVAQYIYKPCYTVAWLLIIAILAVLVPLSRLWLKEHTKAELVLGAITGIVGALLALLVYAR